MGSRSYQAMRLLPTDDLELPQLQSPSSPNPTHSFPSTSSTRVSEDGGPVSPGVSPLTQGASAVLSGVEIASSTPHHSVQAEHAHTSSRVSGEIEAEFTTNPARLSMRSLRVHWIQEIGACILALVVVVALVVTLYPQRSKPLPQWPFRVSINSLLAIYTVILKGTVAYVMTSCIGQMQWVWFTSERPLHDAAMYGEAGRGPWGSLQLLYNQRFIQPLSAVGAIITIMAVALDPMVQGLVRPVDCSTEVKGEVASLPRTNAFHYDTDYFLAQNSYGRLNHDIWTRGIYYSASTLSAECSKGNCTFWDGYSTLGYCSYCDDITSQLQFHTACQNRSNTCEEDSQDAENVTAILPSGFSMTFWPPESAEEIENIWYGTIDMCRMQRRLDSRPDLIQVELIARKTGPRQYGTGIIETSPFTQDGCQSPSAGTDWNCHGYGAAICTLYPCIQNYKTTVAAGRMSETLVERSDPVPWGNFSRNPEGLFSMSNAYLFFNMSLMDTKCLSAAEKDMLRTTIPCVGEWQRGSL